MKKILMNKNTEILDAEFDSATGFLHIFMMSIILTMLPIS